MKLKLKIKDTKRLNSQKTSSKKKSTPKKSHYGQGIIEKPSQKRKTMVDLTDEEIEQKLKEKEQRDSDPRNQERYYVTNAALLAELIKWRDSNKEEEDELIEKYGEKEAKKYIDYSKRVISEELGLMFMELTRKISNHSFFRNYPLELKQDMAGYAYEKLCGGLKNFNFKYKNAFAYLSQATFNAYKTTLSHHYKQVNIKRDLTKQAIVKLDSYIPNSSISKCLNNQFEGNDFDDFSEF